METPLFFNKSGYNLFGVLHEPDECTSIPSPDLRPLKNIGIVFCHPFAEEKLASHRVIVNLARSLTKAGIYSFRFDYMGHGDSSGNFEDATIESRISDIKKAVLFFQDHTKVDTIILLGFRLGATLAVLANEQTPQVNSLILIAPIVDGKTYIEQCLRSNLTTQLTTYKKILKDRTTLVNDLMAELTVNIDGYLLSKLFYQQITSINLADHPIISTNNVLLVQISRNAKQPIEDGINKLYTNYTARAVPVELLNIADLNFWNDTKIYNPYAHKVQETVLGWLTKAFS